MKIGIPGHHPSKTGPGAPRHQETHGGVRYGVPSSANEQDDGGVERIQLQGRRQEGQKEIGFHLV